MISLWEENQRLTRAYEEIEEQYRPFKDQIDGLEGINLLLRNQTSQAQSEAQRLSEEYARLLGHQNQKQKIQHVKKLKDENASLKQVYRRNTKHYDIYCFSNTQEITRLKTDISRLKQREDGGVSVDNPKKKPRNAASESKPLSAKN